MNYSTLSYNKFTVQYSMYIAIQYTPRQYPILSPDNTCGNFQFFPVWIFYKINLSYSDNNETALYSTLLLFTLLHSFGPLPRRSTED